MFEYQAVHGLVVVGCQWGDEGKGKIVDVLAEERRPGGALPGRGQRRAHRTRGEDEFILHQIPSGILHPEPALPARERRRPRPVQFFEEYDELAARGIAAEGRRG